MLNSIHITHAPPNDTAISRIVNYPIDRTVIDQEHLDITIKDRASLFPWRGQFSPQLVDLLLDHYAHADSIVLDPFVGSGNTLFEAARRRITAYGVEINPAAYVMASTVQFVELPLDERRNLLMEAEHMLSKHFALNGDLFAWTDKDYTQQSSAISLPDAIRHLMDKATQSKYIWNIINNTIMQYIGYDGNGSRRSIAEAFQRHSFIVKALPYHTNPTCAYLADARKIPLPAASIDLVITSPPYINVFNYHQNYRRAMELLGWNLLRVGRSEIGSNRKHRSNRLLTVIQYALDMYDTLRELRRLLKPTGRAIVIIGRESRVRGIPFNNAALLGAQAVVGAGFNLGLRQERKFTNKFGQLIFEDLLHLLPNGDLPDRDESVPREIARMILKDALTGSLDTDVRADLIDAYDAAFSVESSLLFDTEAARRIAV